MKKSAVVIFPGRGTYGKDELGYLARHHGDKTTFLAGVDQWRAQQSRTAITEIDAMEKYSAGVHASSINASALTYACALADFADIDREAFDITAICGNSLGWYLTLAAAQSLPPERAVALVDTMGALMEDQAVGGQLVYPLVDDQWRNDPAREAVVEQALISANEKGRAFVSILLGGMVVLAGDDAGLTALEAALPQVDGRYPFRLARHSAFHTPLLEHVSKAALANSSEDDFRAPNLPMIDGRGAIWTRSASNVSDLRSYTLGAQITMPYDFSKSIEVAIKEFAPDCLILAGPGSTLGAPIAQELIRHRWAGIDSRETFMARQKENPFLIAMGREDQRQTALGG